MVFFVGKGPASPTEQQSLRTDIGLSEVDNTADINKPISTAQQSALNDRLLTQDFAKLLPRPEDWGAVGDGRDDTLAMQAAFNSGERIIYIPSKTFVCDALRIDSRIELRSLAGRTGTIGGYPIFKLANSASGDQLTLGPNGILSVSHLSLAGNRANQTQPRSGIVGEGRSDGVYGQMLIADRLIARDYSGAVLKAGLNRNAIKLLRCLIQGGALGGLILDGSQDLSAIDSEFSLNEKSNIIFDSAAGATASHLLHLCRVYYAGFSYSTGTLLTPGIPGVLIKGSANRSVSFFDGQINANSGEGVRIDATDGISDQNFVFDNVEFNGNSNGSSGTYSNIYTATKNVRLSGHYAGYNGSYQCKHILEVTTPLLQTSIVCDIVADANAYATSYSNGNPLRGQLDQSQGQYTNFSATTVNMTIAPGRRHFDINANGSDCVLTSLTSTETEGYVAWVNIHSITPSWAVLVKKAAGTTSLTFKQPGLYMIVYRSGAWIGSRVALAGTALPDGGTSGREYVASTAGTTVSAPVTATLINLAVGSSATLEKLQMNVELEVQGVVLDLIVRTISAGGVLNIIKSTGAQSTTVTTTGLYRLVYTQGLWKVTRLGEIPV